MQGGCIANIGSCGTGFDSASAEFDGPTGPVASQAQALTFLVRDQRLGANVGSAQGPTGLGKYLMPSPTGEGLDFPEEKVRYLLVFLKWDGLQTPEMQSRLRALPFLTGLTRGRLNLTSSGACFTATHSS
ncbi:photosystem II CP43 reaction center protein-like [Dioscorea cayenensis subsp. rotundata]|uniref:Photosystem II CP43 reaction center protein-like n=1 Tax=Dioscorea cayennensis subsp. rotundata TaxID=55577 RepID=A0AB40AV57_DIOCR|nr:photosystem II CP43 reaction center protein-like [Dioscorea cayenensis subsp. rotundata]